MSKSPVSSTGKIERAPKPKGRNLCDKKGAVNLSKKQAKTSWPITLQATIQAIASLNLNTSKGCLNNGKSANFLGHIEGSKSAAIDTVCLKLAKNEISISQFNETLAREQVTMAKKHDVAALKKKLADHCRHYNLGASAKVDFMKCLLHAGFTGERAKAIQVAMGDFLTAYRNTL